MPRSIPLLALWAAGWMACGSPPETAKAPEVTEVPREQLHLRATYADGQPVAAAAVKLNGAEAGRTDAAGELLLEVPEGQHQLELQLDSADGTFSRVVQTVEKGTEAQEVKVHLPRPVRMLEPREVTTSRVHLAWEKSKDQKFREYKVYAHQLTPALDEANGMLVHVGTDASQTDFLLTGLYTGGSLLVAANVNLYFRVFVLTEDGRLAGSNVIQVKTPTWENEPHFSRHYTLSRERVFAGAHPIQGVAYDGSALWFLYREVGGDPNAHTLTLVQHDPETLSVLRKLTLGNFRRGWGLAFDGASLWLLLRGSDLTRLVSVNPTTGARERDFSGDPGVSSMAWTGTHLLQSRYAHKAPILRVDLVTGFNAGTLTNPFTQMNSDLAAGIAYRPGELWLSDTWKPGLVIIDDAGVHVGVVASDSTYAHMTFMGDKLVGVTRDSQVHVLKVEP
ncbi:fibronectin type III domain-containing protein [Pyxidicoccus xibeiensis]|uniref:fibronectin type III domain-containing protein n=1 Tax=Pyxidicoccus xibeiensis TaxID=2906759 RepID=UPI0020A6E02D|nr:fibronectin type III domain-containing protein [Pyxidicoccus xibeiensis]MCP3138119.1 fibronectin type III domain-containing protein [Pyxidicoccus xibeiensis]